MGSWTHATDKSFPELMTELLEAQPGSRVVVRRGRYYAVANAEGDVSAFVALGSKRDGVVSYKLLHESENTNLAAAPAAILNALTPTAFPEAIRWRERCQARIDRLAAQPSLTPGDRIVFHDPFTFSDDVTESTFVFVDRFTLRRACDRRLVTLPRSWKTRDWALINEQEDNSR